MAIHQKAARPKAEPAPTHNWAKNSFGPTSRSSTPAPVEARHGSKPTAQFGHDLSGIQVYPDDVNLAREDMSDPGDESEREAERVSSEVTGVEVGLPQISARPAPIQRFPGNIGQPFAPVGNPFLPLPLPTFYGEEDPGAAAGDASASGAAGGLSGKVGEAANGIAGAAQSGLGWLGDTAGEALSGGISSPDWLMGKGREAVGGISGAASSAMGWLGGTQNQAASGVAAGGKADGTASNAASKSGAESKGFDTTVGQLPPEVQIMMSMQQMQSQIQGDLRKP